jgi:hypothetical protein
LISGKTWSDVGIIAGNSSYRVTNPRKCVALALFSSFEPSTEVLATASNKVILIYNIVGPDISMQTNVSTNGMIISKDDGVTWSATMQVNIYHQIMHPPNRTDVAPGPGNLLQLKQGPNKGRILTVGNIGGSDYRDAVSYSDDDGVSWTPVQQTFPLMMEAQLTELTNGMFVLLAVPRITGNQQTL